MPLEYRTLESFAKYITGTAAEFSAKNPVLQPGELGIESNTGVIKIGNGDDAWSSLITGGEGSGDLSEIEADIAAIEAAITGYAEGVSGGEW